MGTSESAPGQETSEREASEQEAPSQGMLVKKALKEKEMEPKTHLASGRKERGKEYQGDFQPIKMRVDEDEDREHGDINPYTGHEYRTNSVRMHPKRIGYVQVYDRRTHKWTDMTEWAFLGFEERKKAIQGKDYEPPIYLD